jgi:hypothetical protein
MGPDSIFVQAAGGHIIMMDLPLHEAAAEQLTKGYLRRVNADGSPYVEPVEGDGPPPEPKPPAKSAVKAEWVGWAVMHPDESRRMTPDDAEALTKDDLIERFGKPDLPPPQ